ncbi:MAG: arginine deiminase [Bacteroidales bacterium]|nr:arginine deiminase [Bacteroidales bacterium]
MIGKNITPCKVNVASETGRLRAVLLHRPGVEIERMTPLNASHALYSDILNKPIVDTEYHYFSGVLERWTDVYYVEDILEQLLDDAEVRRHLVEESCDMDDCDEGLADELMTLDSKELAKVLIEGYEDPEWGLTPQPPLLGGEGEQRYLLQPLYNLFFTRDASSTVYDRVLINSMSFEVRERETLIYEAIFRHFFKVDTLNAMAWDRDARTEGGDVQIASPDLLCIGQGIRTNTKGIKYLSSELGARSSELGRPCHILVQELPKKPESFIHLDMVFTFLGKHQCMAFEPMLKKQGLFAGKDTTLITVEGGKISYDRFPNIIKGLEHLGWEIEPVIGGGSDPWVQLREQWHSGANFFALGDGKVMGYRRNTHTIDALDKAGFAVLKAEDIVEGKVNMADYDKFVAAFPGSELPRAGGGARCMTMPILRDAQ